MQNPTLFRRQLNSWFKANQRALPWRQNRSPYNTWVSELMLQQTQVTTMVKYFERWIKELPNVEALAAADDEHVMHLWQGLGYYSRARNLKKGAQYIIEHHQGQLPQTIEELMDIPGIGRYTAGAIASLAFNIKAPIVDGNILRVFSRLYNLDAPINEQKAKNRIYQLQFDLVPTKNPGPFNESLMELGALICTPKNTHCDVCPVQEFCQAYKKQTVHLLPKKLDKKPVTKISSCAIVLQNKNKFYLHKRPQGERMGGLWEFPEYKSPEGIVWKEAQAQEHLLQTINPKITKTKYLGRIKRQYTRFSETMHIFESQVPKSFTLANDWEYSWTNAQQLKDFALTSAHNKIRNKIT